VIIDTSALVAIFANEPEREQFLEAITSSSECAVAAPTLLETSLVLSKFGPQLDAWLQRFVREAAITIVPFDETHLAAAQKANLRYGRTSGHPAKLNFGDCFSYAACTVSGRPLLFKGTAFSKTDIVSAVS
jgi:ribonuclease VapC